MESVVNFTYRHHRHHQLPFINHHRPSISKPISSLSFTTSSSSLKKSCFSSLIKASYSNFPSPTPNPPKTTPISPLKSTLIVAVTAAALFLSQLNLKPVLASTAVSAPPPPAKVESESEPDLETESGYEADPEEEEKEEFVPMESKPVYVIDPVKEKNLEQQIASNPKDIHALRALMVIKLEGKKLEDALELVNKLMVLKPNYERLPLLKASLQASIGNHEESMKTFNGIISKHPFRIEAYLGLLKLASKKSPKDLVDTEKKIKEGLEKAKKSKNRSLVKKFNYLLAEVLVIKKDYQSALRIYKDLIKEEPRDFNPYLRLGMIYTLLKNDADANANANFEKFRRLVPEGHPLRQEFEDNMREAKLAAQKEANAKLYSRR